MMDVSRRASLRRLGLSGPFAANQWEIDLRVGTRVVSKSGMATGSVPPACDFRHRCGYALGKWRVCAFH